MESMAKIVKFAKSNRHVQESLNIIQRAFTTYKLDNTCISFNGGKDCTALLHLIHSVIETLGLDEKPKILAFYSQLPNHFEEESSFVNDMVRKYNIKLMQYSTSSLKISLSQLKNDVPHLEAIFMGTRCDDLKPGTHLDSFAPTDQDWPKFMRVNPILNWSYKQVWDFIRELEVPYCDLYDQGYSSLGTRDNTRKNSSLLRFNESGEPYYLPAWNLTKSDEERLSRSSSLDVASNNNDSVKSNLNKT